jgi:hypothetical protein
MMQEAFPVDESALMKVFNCVSSRSARFGIPEDQNKPESAIAFMTAWDFQNNISSYLQYLALPVQD